MCGIAAIVLRSGGPSGTDVEPGFPNSLDKLYEALKNRGPHKNEELRLTLGEARQHMHLFGSVLHIQGNKVTPQPYCKPPVNYNSNCIDSCGGIGGVCGENDLQTALLWNGEVFNAPIEGGGVLSPIPLERGGRDGPYSTDAILHHRFGENDTVAISSLLEKACDEAISDFSSSRYLITSTAVEAGAKAATEYFMERRQTAPNISMHTIVDPVRAIASRIAEALKAVHGPYAFIYWHAPSGTLFYGRDPFGRRSLLTLCKPRRTEVAAEGEREGASVGTPNTLATTNSVLQHNDGFRPLCISSVALATEVVNASAPAARSDNFRSADVSAAFTLNKIPTLGMDGLLWKEVDVCGVHYVQLRPCCAELLADQGQEEHPVDASTRPALGCGFVEWPHDRIRLRRPTLTPVTASALLRQTTASLTAVDSLKSDGCCDGGDESCVDLSQRFLAVLQGAITRRVRFMHADTNPSPCLLGAEGFERFMQHIEEQVTEGNPQHQQQRASKKASKDGCAPSHRTRRCRVGVLFSGGIDSVLLAALLHRALENDPLEPIELVNVTFLRPRKAAGALQPGPELGSVTGEDTVTTRTDNDKGATIDDAFPAAAAAAAAAAATALPALQASAPPASASVPAQSDSGLTPPPHDTDLDLSPDRLAAVAAYGELRALFPTREWRLVHVDVPAWERHNCQQRVLDLIQVLERPKAITVIVELK